MYRFEWDYRTVIGTIQWRVPHNVTLGLFRIRYFSTANKKEFVCATRTFSVN